MGDRFDLIKSPSKIANINGLYDTNASLSLPMVVSSVDRYRWKKGL
jgi:hypothetical protein